MNPTVSTNPIPPFKAISAFAGTTRYPPKGQLGPRIQQDLQLVLLHTGELEVKVDNVPHRVQPGSVILLKPGYKEFFAFAEEEESWHRWIALTVETLSPEAMQFFGQLPWVIPISDEMNQLVDMMLSIQSRNLSVTREGVIAAMGLSAIMLFVEECINHGQSKRMHPAIIMAKQIIHSRYTEELSLTRLAELSGLTPEHLIRLFQRYEQRTPIQYLWNYRLSRGLDLLQNTGLGIGEVAYRVGFKSSYHFARTVKRQTGCTPTEIRRNSWSGITQPTK